MGRFCFETACGGLVVVEWWWGGAGGVVLETVKVRQVNKFEDLAVQKRNPTQSCPAEPTED